MGSLLGVCVCVKSVAVSFLALCGVIFGITARSLCGSYGLLVYYAWV